MIKFSSLSAHTSLDPFYDCALGRRYARYSDWHGYSAAHKITYGRIKLQKRFAGGELAGRLHVAQQ